MLLRDQLIYDKLKGDGVKRLHKNDLMKSMYSCAIDTNH